MGDMDWDKRSPFRFRGENRNDSNRFAIQFCQDFKGPIRFSTVTDRDGCGCAQVKILKASHSAIPEICDILLRTVFSVLLILRNERVFLFSQRCKGLEGILKAALTRHQIAANIGRIVPLSF